MHGSSLIGELRDEYTRVQWLGNLDLRVGAVLLEALRQSSHAEINEAMGVQVRPLAAKLGGALKSAGRR